MRGIERRIAAGLDPRVSSVASLFVSRWDVAANSQLPKALSNRLGIAVATLAYRANRQLLASARWQRLAAAGALPQRLLWASTGTKDPSASDTLYVAQLVARDTVNTVPEKTLLAFADHGRVEQTLTLQGGDAEAVLADCGRHGVSVDALAALLQRQGAEAFTASWRSLLSCIAGKAKTLSQAGV